MASDGWIKVWRRTLNHPCLTQHDERGLWLTLLLRAAHEPTEVRFRGKVVKLARGQLAISLREEAERGGTSYKRTRSIVDLMRREKMITLGADKGAHFCILTICNYDEFQTEGAQSKAQKGRSQGALRAQSGRTEQEGKEDKKIPSPDGEGAKPLTGQALVDAASKAWNEICGDVLPRVSKLTEDRRAKLRQVLADDCGNDLQAWAAYCKRIRSSGFCCGQNSRGWRADIDFAIKAGRYPRVLEGKYDNNSPVVAAYRGGRKSYNDYAREHQELPDDDQGHEALFGVPVAAALLCPSRADDDAGGYGGARPYLRAVAGGL